MSITPDASFLYRFRSTPGKVYGPSPLEWIRRTYENNDDCECAPAAEDTQRPIGDWRPVFDWLVEVDWPPPDTATERQLARLTKLSIPHDPATITADEAREAITAAEALLPPTKHQFKVAADLELPLPDGATRGQVKALVEEHGRAEQLEEDQEEARGIAERLRRAGLPIAEGLSLAEVWEFEHAWEGLHEAMKDARRVGFALPLRPGITPQEMERFTDALWSLPEVVDTVTEWKIEQFQHDGIISGRPTKAAIKAALPDLFARMLSGEWTGGDDDYLWFILRASELREEERNRETPRPAGQPPPRTGGFLAQLKRLFR